MSVGKKLIKGAAWNALSEFGSQGINLVVFIILARLLVPKDFGLVLMATVFITFLGYFTDFGLMSALIQAKEVDDGDFNTVFWSTILLSGVVYVTSFLCAPFIAVFYNESRLILIIRILFINFLFAALAYIPEVTETRKLHYDKIAMADLMGMVISGIVGISFAVMKFNVWSLVAQQITKTFVRSTVLIFYTNWRPKAYFSVIKFRSLIKSGTNFVLKDFVYYCSNNMDSILIGKFLGPTALGIYSLSLRIASYANAKIALIFGKMLMPAFGLFRNEIERVKKNFVRVSVGGGIILVPFLVGLFFGARPIVEILFGEHWLEAIPIVSILVIYFIFDSLSFPDEPILMALGKVKTITIIRLIFSLAFFIVGYIAINKFGLIGIAVVSTIVSVAQLVAINVSLLAVLNIRWYSYLKSIKIVCVSTFWLFMIFCFYSLAVHQQRSPLLYLLGEAVIIGVFMVFLVAKYKLMNKNDKKINFDNLLTVNL